MPTRLIIIIAMFAAALVMGFTLFWPNYQSFARIQSEFNQKQAELDSKTAYYSKIKETWGKLENRRDALAKINSALPSGFSMPVLFNYLKTTSGDSGLILENLTFGGLTGDKIKEVSISLQMSGDYSSFKNFLSAIENSVRFFKIKSISFSSSKNGKFLFNLGIATYNY